MLIKVTLANYITQKTHRANEHSHLVDEAIHTENLTPGDLDSYEFNGNPDDEVLLSVEDDIRLYIRLYSPSGTVFRNSQSKNLGLIFQP